MSPAWSLEQVDLDLVIIRLIILCVRVGSFVSTCKVQWLIYTQLYHGVPDETQTTNYVSEWVEGGEEKMFCLKTSLRTVPISQRHRQLFVTSAKNNRGPTTSEEQELKFARAKVRIRVLYIIYSVVSYMALLLTHIPIFLTLGWRFCTIRASARKSVHIRRISSIVLGKTFTKGGWTVDKIRPRELWWQMCLRDSGAELLGASALVDSFSDNIFMLFIAM